MQSDPSWTRLFRHAVGIRLHWLAALATGLALAACAGLPEDGAQGAAQGEGSARVWITTADHAQALAMAPEAHFGQEDARAIHIQVDTDKRYQRMLGFGASITDASAWLIQHRMSPTQRDALLRELFGREGNGVGFGFTRLTIGASDFSRHHYSLDDVPAGQSDPKLAKFSIAPNRGDVIPVTRAALAVNPDLKVMASPWSAPAWMKTTDSLHQGHVAAAVLRRVRALPGALRRRLCSRRHPDLRAHATERTFVRTQGLPGHAPERAGTRADHRPASRTDAVAAHAGGADLRLGPQLGPAAGTVGGAGRPGRLALRVRGGLALLRRRRVRAKPGARCVSGQGRVSDRMLRRHVGAREKRRVDVAGTTARHRHHAKLGARRVVLEPGARREPRSARRRLRHLPRHRDDRLARWHA